MNAILRFHPSLKSRRTLIAMLNSIQAEGSSHPHRHRALLDCRLKARCTGQPFNAEPHRAALVSSYITPVDFFYKRNHGPIPVVDDIERYHVSVGGMVEKPIQISMSEIKKLPKYTVTATLQCAGNRRTTMSKTRTVRGVGWNVSALGNATWGGAKLSDVLELVGISKLSSMSSLGGKHVEFTSVDKCKSESSALELWIMEAEDFNLST